MQAQHLEFVSGADVEKQLIEPLFSKTLQYPEAAFVREPMTAKGPRNKLQQAALYVAYVDNSPVIAVQAKPPTESVRHGYESIDLLAQELHAPFSVLTNGSQFLLRGYYTGNEKIDVVVDSVSRLREEKWKRLKKLIGFTTVRSAINQSANDIEQPNEDKIKDYRRFFRKLHNEIRDRDKIDPSAAFDELSKLLFLKAAEDQLGSSSPRLTPKLIDSWLAEGKPAAKQKIDKWFKKATSAQFGELFGDDPQIKLSPQLLKRLLVDLEPFNIQSGDVDVKGRAFEEFLPSQLRGKGLGQFFTPRPVVNFMVEMARVSIYDSVVDFACGSGGFLIRAFDEMRTQVAQVPDATIRSLSTTRDELMDQITSNQLFGVDAEPRAARTAKMNMLMWGDGRRIVRGNALDARDFANKKYHPREYSPTDDSSGCSLILANPPFGGKEKNKEILRRYQLSADKDVERTEVLFIEKGLKLLRPGGRMLIVLPQGLLSSSNNSRVRDFIHAHAEIRAVISLPTHTFVQSGVATANTCVVYLQKFTDGKRAMYAEQTKNKTVQEVRELLRTDPAFDYPIFMGMAEYVGFEPSGRDISNGAKTDLDELLDDFARSETLGIEEIDVFKFATDHFQDAASRRRDQVVRGSQRGMKTSFVVNLSRTDDRLDPSYYLFRARTESLLRNMTELAPMITERRDVFLPTTEEQLDAEYQQLSVSSDGGVTPGYVVRGETLKPTKRVKAGDVVYNPMRVNIGSIGVVPAELGGGLVSPDYVVFHCSGISPHFLVALLRSPFYRNYIDVVSTGSIRDRLYFSDLGQLRVPSCTDSQQDHVREAARRIGTEAEATNEKLRRRREEYVTFVHDIVKAAIAKSFTESADVEARFNGLVQWWSHETAVYSSPVQLFEHPAYQAIIAMGTSAVPFLLRELRDRPALWFFALESILKQNPVAPERSHSLQGAISDWMAWANHNGVTIP